MDILNRISTLVRSNVNDLLDKTDNPPALLRQFLRDIDGAMAEAREGLASAMTAEKLVEGDWRQAESLTIQWGEKARLAESRGADDLARECLRRKRDYASNASAYQKQLSSASQSVSLMRRQILLLQRKRSEIAHGLEFLEARLTIAKARQKVGEKLADISFDDPGALVRRMEARILNAEARAEVTSNLLSVTIEQQLESLTFEEEDLEIEADLLELKRGRLGPGIDSESEQ